MKKLLILLSLLVVIALAASPAMALIGGELDTEHSNVGALIVDWPKDPENPITIRLCTATLIHPQVLVTAAHCYWAYEWVWGFDYDKVWISFDPDPLSHEETYLGVQAIIPHPEFSAMYSHQNDIALVILDRPVPAGMGITPERLPVEGYLDDALETIRGRDARNVQMTVVGYGATSDLPVPDKYLDAIRRVGTVTFSFLKPLQILTTYSDETDAKICTGDSGGPIFYVDNNGNEVLVGVHSSSSGYGCEVDLPNEISVKYRIDTADALGFIYDTIAEYFPPE